MIVICGVNTGETLERWAFNVETDKAVTAGAGGVAKKSQKEISSGKRNRKTIVEPIYFPKTEPAVKAVLNEVPSLLTLPLDT